MSRVCMYSMKAYPLGLLVSFSVTSRTCKDQINRGKFSKKAPLNLTRYVSCHRVRCLSIFSIFYTARQTGIKPKTAVLTLHM